MNFIKCPNEINPGRLKALPGTKVCVKCSTTNAWYLRNVVAGKTEYMEHEIIKDPKLADTLREMDKRVGWGSNLKKESI